MSDVSEQKLREDIVEVCRRIYQKGFVAANDGNVSVRLEDNSILTTPAGVSKGFMTPEELVVVDMEGQCLSPGRKPSSELPMHLFIYGKRRDVRAVVHAHPPFSTGFAVAGIPLDKCVLAEVILTIGSIPLTPYGTPSTEELPQALSPYVLSCDAFLLANHGAVTVGEEVFDAYYKLERVEHFAKISFIARLLGGERTLPPQKVEELYQIREKAGVKYKNPGCWTCYDQCIGESCLNFDERDNPSATDRLGELVHQLLEEVT